MVFDRGSSYKLLALIVVPLIILVLLPEVFAAEQTTYEQAKMIFRARCATCHNGALAPKFENVIEKIKIWASKYPSLDEAVKSEYKYMGGAKSYRELMEQMKRLSPTLTREEHKLLYDFFIKVFEEARKAGMTAKQTTPVTKEAKAATETLVQTVKRATTVIAVGPNGTLEPYSDKLTSAMSSTVLVAVGLMTAAAVISIVVYYNRKI